MFYKQREELQKGLHKNNNHGFALHQKYYSPLLLEYLTLQQTVGNREVQQMVRNGEVLTKLFINQPGDRYEQGKQDSYEGALAGLRIANAEINPNWRWYIAICGAASIVWDMSVNIQNDTYEILDTEGNVVSTPGPPTGSGGSGR